MQSDPIRTLIVEDEAPAAARLKNMLLEVEPGMEILGVLESISSAIAWFDTHPHPDLLLLDIQLADGLSFDIFQTHKIDSFVIFATAYDEYAIQAFELNSIAYLLKPIDQGKLEIALEKFHKLRSKNQKLDIQALLDSLNQTPTSGRYKNRFIINLGSRITSIESSQIAWLYSLEKNTFLCTNEGRHYPVDQSLDKLEELLDPMAFFRISRQYILSYRP
jgi:DNA-binding LytR/AlgR family response regulator